MKLKKFNPATLFFLFVFVPFLNFFILQKSFNLGLYGDDWLQLYNLWLEFDVRRTASFFDIRSYLGPYLPQYIFLGLIRNFAGFDPAAYFLASYFLKVLSSISLFLLSKELTKSRLASVFITILFIFSAAGLETTDWVFNMNTFAGLFFFCISLIFYLKMRHSLKFFSRQYLVYALFLLLSLFVVPVRMHGAVPFLIMTDLFLTFIVERKRTVSKLLIFRIVSSIFILFVLVKAGSYGVAEYSSGRAADAFESVRPLISRGQLDFGFYFFGTVGNTIIPNSFDVNPLKQFLNSTILLKTVPFNFVLTISSILLLIDLLISKIIFKRMKLFKIIFIFYLLITFVGMMMSIMNSKIPPQYLFSTLIGLHFFALSSWVYISGKNSNPMLASTALISVFWIFCFSAIYWVYSPHLILDTTSRYLTFGAVGVCIFYGSLIVELLKNLKSRLVLGLLPLGLLLFYLTTHFYSGQSYLGNLEVNRNQILTQKSWDRLIAEVPTLDPNSPSVFYMTTDNPQSLWGVFTFGFWPRAAVVYRIEDPDKTPLLTENYPELLEYVKDGAPLKKVHGRKQEKVPLKRVFAFDFRNGELTNITEEIREKLKKEPGVSF